MRLRADVQSLTVEQGAEAGALSPDKQDAVRLSGPQTTEMATLGEEIAAARIAGATETLEALRIGAILVDRLGRIVEVNPMAEALLGSDFQIRQGRFLGPRRACERLERAIQNALLDKLSKDGAPILIERRGASSLMANVVPLITLIDNPLARGCVLVTLKELGLPASPQTERLQQALGLTRRQAEIAEALARGGRVETIAEQSGVSPSTIRTHIKDLFLRLGVTRQSDLVALVVRFLG